jgi:RNA polymerase sigma factor (sigma-70 family)
LSNHSTTLRYWLGKHNAGDPAAMSELLRFSQDRILAHIRHQFKAFNRLARYVDTEDVLVDVQFKVSQTFRAEPFTDLMHFLRLTARMARNQMVDLTRRYFGPQGAGTQEIHGLNAPASDPSVACHSEPRAADEPPDARALRTEMNDVIAGLPQDHRDLFDLLYYNQLSRADAAEALGVSLSTLDRRWIAAREAFLDRYGNDLHL